VQRSINLNACLERPGGIGSIVVMMGMGINDGEEVNDEKVLIWGGMMWADQKNTGAITYWKQDKRSGVWIVMMMMMG
jgi:hypothetical protein